MILQDDAVLEIGGSEVTGKLVKEIVRSYLGVKHDHTSAVFFQDNIVLAKSSYIKKKLAQR